MCSAADSTLDCGGVDDHDALLGGGIGVDVVETDARPPDHDQVGTGLQDLRRHLGGGADDQGVGALHQLRQRLGGEVQLDVDLVTGLPEAVEARIGDLLGDEHT